MDKITQAFMRRDLLDGSVRPSPRRDRALRPEREVMVNLAGFVLLVAAITVASSCFMGLAGERTSGPVSIPSPHGHSTLAAAVTAPANVDQWISLPIISGGAPPSRSYFQVSYDSADKEVVLFSGTSGTRHLDDTWTYRSGVWTNVTSPTSPPFRIDGSMVDDVAAGYVLLFGGQGCYVTTCNSYQALGDTWAFSGGVWRNLTGSLSVAPPARVSASMAYDAADGYVLLYGGWYPNGYDQYADAWKFQAGSWTELTDAAPPGERAMGAMAYDPGDGYVLLFGGDGFSTGYEYDSWSYHAGTWTQLSPTTSPDLDGWLLSEDTAINGVLAYYFEVGGGGGYTDYFTGGQYTSVCSCGPGSEIQGIVDDLQDGYVLGVGGTGTGEQLWAYGAVDQPVVLSVSPSTCAPDVSVNGTAGSNGTTLLLADESSLPLVAGACSGYTFTSWAGSTYVKVSGETVVATGPGYLYGNYSQSSHPGSGTGSGGPGSAAGTPLWLYLIVVATVAIAAVVAVVLLRSRRRRMSPDAANRAPPPDGAPPGYPAPGYARTPYGYDPNGPVEPGPPPGYSPAPFSPYPPPPGRSP